MSGSSFQSTKIEDIRNLKKKIFQTSISDKPRFIIFNDVELFNHNSLNALLKIIEEPSKNNHFILIDNKTKPLIETIKSRCLEIKIILKENKCVNIYSSYSSPFIDQKIFLFTNGIVYQNDDVIEIRGPAMNLNTKNHFIKPKLIKKISLKNEKDYAESLEKSFKYFFNVIKKNQTFSKKETNISLKSNQLLF